MTADLTADLTADMTADLKAERRNARRGSAAAVRLRLLGEQETLCCDATHAARRIHAAGCGQLRIRAEHAGARAERRVGLAGSLRRSPARRAPRTRRLSHARNVD